MKERIINWVLCALGQHEYVSNGIDDGTMCDVHVWCKHCGKVRTP